MRFQYFSHVKLPWIQAAAIAFNTMVICVFWWCIVVGIVLSLIINDIIAAPPNDYATSSVIIFMAGGLGLIVTLSSFQCLQKKGKCGFISYITSLCVLIITLMSVAVQLISTSNNPGILLEWVDTNLQKIYQSGFETIRGMEAVYLIENQYSCCGFNGTTFYPPAALSPGCCPTLERKCTIDIAHKKACRVAFVEMVQERFHSFGASLLWSIFFLLAAIVNTSIMLAKVINDEAETEVK